jgi:hypothetical protein
MDIREIVELFQWLAFVGAFYYLFEKRLGEDLQGMRASLEIEREKRSEQHLDTLERLHAVEQRMADVETAAYAALVEEEEE